MSYDPTDLGMILGPEALRRLAQIDASDKESDEHPDTARR